MTEIIIILSIVIIIIILTLCIYKYYKNTMIEHEINMELESFIINSTINDKKFSEIILSPSPPIPPTPPPSPL